MNLDAIMQKIEANVAVGLCSYTADAKHGAMLAIRNSVVDMRQTISGTPEQQANDALVRRADAYLAWIDDSTGKVPYSEHPRPLVAALRDAIATRNVS